jgi:hypothetical protein
MFKRQVYKFFNQFYTNSLKIHKKYIISKMEKHTSSKEQVELNKLLSEMNVKEANMPEIPLIEPRQSRYRFINQ